MPGRRRSRSPTCAPCSSPPTRCRHGTRTPSACTATPPTPSPASTIPSYAACSPDTPAGTSSAAPRPTVTARSQQPPADRCRRDIQTGKAFLDHLTAHHHDLDDCSQSCLDAWITADRGRRLGFIRWLKRGGYLPRTRLPEPIPSKDPRHDIDPDQQLDLARRLLHDADSASIEDRAAACLVLLYTQPIAKIVTLTTADIRAVAGDTYLALGREPLLLIPPLDALITALPAAKAFGTASTLADHRWLFTGKNAGAHLQPPSLMARMSRLGITARARRNTALLHLASTTPPAIFTNLIGVNIGTVTRWAGLAGATWNSYATTPRCQDANKRMAPKDR